jgi:hypothetical protein
MGSLDWLPEFALDLARGECALWLGSRWDEAVGDEDLSSIGNKPWLAVWSEARSRVLALQLKQSAVLAEAGRLLVEVPDSVQDVLGDSYPLAQLLPVFYLEGSPESVTTDPAARQRVRTFQEDELRRVRSATLVAGYFRDQGAAVRFLQDPVRNVGNDIARVLLLGVSEDDGVELLKGLPSSLQTRVVCFPGSLTELLDLLETRRRELPAEPTVRVGSTRIPLRLLLSQAPPIDQEFLVLTEQDVADPEPDEDRAALTFEFLRGTHVCWRAFAANIPWRRHGDNYVDAVRRALWECRRSDGSSSATLTLPAEPGAGLTVTLQEIAFRCAREGFPVLMLRANSQSWTVDRLRVFLRDLYRLVRPVNSPDCGMPVLLIFDSQHDWGDRRDSILRLAGRLSEQSRVVVLRGIEWKAGEADSGLLVRDGTRVVGPVIRAGLQRPELEALMSWATEAQLQLSVGTIAPPVEGLAQLRNWDGGREAPLLVCLYYFLVHELRTQAELGRHLWRRLEDGFELPRGGGGGPEEHGERRNLAEMLRNLPQTFGRGTAGASATVSDEAVLSAVMLLAGLGCLRVSVPASTLSRIVQAMHPRSVSDTGALLRRLEKTTLVVTDIPVASGVDPVRHGGRLAPAAFYADEPGVGLRHPQLGRLILDWLGTGSDAGDARAAVRKMAPQLSSILPSGPVAEYPLEFLRPVLENLTARPDDMKLAENISCQYLRLQKGLGDPKLEHWMWYGPSNHNNVRLMLAAFEWLRPNVLQQSSVLLHSRGITSYKSTGWLRTLDEKRTRYREAVGYLERATELAEQMKTGEAPAVVQTSLGLLYLYWARLEREEGQDEEWRRLNRTAVEVLRRAYALRSDNTFAAYGLASYLVETCELHIQDGVALPDRDVGAYLAEALELLSMHSPEASFEAEWEQLQARACILLNAEEATSLIAGLQASGDELGYALAALRVLNGAIPTSVDLERGQALAEALHVLSGAETVQLKQQSHLADLLRYALFSALPEREHDPAFDKRYELMQPLRATPFLERANWLYDWAMLCFQNGNVSEGVEAFRELRRRALFRQVPRDQWVYWSKGPKTTEPRLVRLRVTDTGEASGKGWGRLAPEEGVRDSVPFGPDTFRGRITPRAGATLLCRIRLRAAGPWAEPPPMPGE